MTIVDKDATLDDLRAQLKTLVKEKEHMRKLLVQTIAPHLVDDEDTVMWMGIKVPREEMVERETPAQFLAKKDPPHDERSGTILSLVSKLSHLKFHGIDHD